MAIRRAGRELQPGNFNFPESRRVGRRMAHTCLEIPLAPKKKIIFFFQQKTPKNHGKGRKLSIGPVSDTFRVVWCSMVNFEIFDTENFCDFSGKTGAESHQIDSKVFFYRLHN